VYACKVYVNAREQIKKIDASLIFWFVVFVYPVLVFESFVFM